MNKILGFVAKHSVGVATAVCTGAYLIYLGISNARGKKWHDKQMETQELLQTKIRETYAKAQEPEES